MLWCQSHAAARFRRLLGYLLAALLLFPALAYADSAQATLDRNQVQLGESVTLNLRIDGSRDAVAPDLSALAADFTIQVTSSNASLSIINGVPQSQLIYGVVLRPKHVGVLQIPALSIGGEQTAPLQLEVTAADPATATSSGGKGVFIEASADTAKAYVGQQLVYTLRLYFLGALTSGALDDPLLPGVDVRRLGDDVQYQVQRDGRSYHVIERHYALLPQHAGHIEIPPVDFQGETIDPTDPNSFFNSGTPLTAQSPAVSIDVQAPSAGSAHSLWLPARQLQLSLDGLPAHGQLRVGQPLNLSMSLQAVGLPFESLPALSLPTLDGATVYPDKPVTGTHSDGQWLIGRRQQNFAVVPDRPGTLNIPETTLQWFNVVTGKPETARIEAHSFQVLSAVGAATPAPTASTVLPAAAAGPAPLSVGHAAAPVAAPAAWRWIALASLGLWLLSLVSWLLWRRQRAKPSSPPMVTASRDLRAAFMQVCSGSDSARQAQALLAWARAERPTLQNLGELAAALAADDQRAAIAALQRRRYAQPALQQPGADLHAAFQRGFVWCQSGARPADELLPPLYPFKLD